LIPAKHWWCGCGDGGKDFFSERGWVTHMKSKIHGWKDKDFERLKK